MKRLPVVLAAFLLVLAIAPGATAAQRVNLFTGQWRGTDADGSAMTLAITGGGSTRHMVQRDTSCGLCVPPGFPAVGVGWGVVDGQALEASLIWRQFGPGVQPSTALVESTFTFDAPSGTLVQAYPDCLECTTQVWYPTAG